MIIMDSSQSNLTSQSGSLFTGELESTTSDNITDTLLSSTSSLTVGDSDLHITKEMINEKQLQHDLELAKIELSQKNLVIDTMKAEYLSKIDEVEEKLSDAIHQKQIIIAKFQNQMRTLREEYNHENKNLKQQVQFLLQKQREINLDNEKLTEKAIKSKDLLTNLDIDEDEYLSIKGKNPDELTLREFIAIQFYESLKPLNVQCQALQNRVELSTNEILDREEDLAKALKELEEERHGRLEGDMRCQKLQIQLDELRDQLKRKDYKNENFDSLRRDKDQLEKENAEAQRNLLLTKADLQTKSEENESLRNEVIDIRQTVNLLKQDKDYLSKQLFDLKPRHDYIQQKLEETMKSLEDTRAAREDLYEKYLHSRDLFKSEYEEKLRREISELSNKTSLEMEKIKKNSHEIFERENRALKEARDNALAEKQRFGLTAKEAEDRQKEVVAELRHLQVASDSKISEITNELKLKTFEAERMQLVYTETCRNLEKANLENQQLLQQKEVLSKEHNALQLATRKRITELECKESEMGKKLTVYEKMQDELDNVIMQAAEMSDDQEAERVLFSYGYGANIPSTARRRMQQSVHLAKRVLQLERANSSLRSECKKGEDEKEKLTSELERTTNLLREAKQPYNYLIESITVRDDENKNMKGTIKSLHDDITRLKAENTSLAKLNDQMTLDLERLLNNREEMSVLKRAILDMRSATADRKTSENFKPSAFSKRKTTRIGNGFASTQADSGMGSLNSTPKPILITKQDAPSWYERLKKLNEKKQYKSL